MNDLRMRNLSLHSVHAVVGVAIAALVQVADSVRRAVKQGR